MADSGEQAFLARMTPQVPAAFVLGSGTPHTLEFVRSLGRRGIPVAAVGVLPGATATSRVLSRYCRIDRAFEAYDGLLAFLQRIGPSLPRKAVILPTGDDHVMFLSRNRTALGEYFEFVIPEDEAVECLTNKRTQYEYAASIGMPLPRTCIPRNGDELEQIAAELGYPCVVKPAYSDRWREYQRLIGVRQTSKATEASTAAELRTVYDHMSSSGLNVIIQEKIGGPTSRLHSLYAYLDRDSRPLGAVIAQKLREAPPVYGTSSYSVTVRQDEVKELGLKLLQATAYRGLASIEFKQDPKDGLFKLIEVNVRSGLQIAICAAAGVDLPYIAYRDICGQPPKSVNHRAGVTRIDTLADLDSFPHYHRTEGLSFWRWAWSALTARSHAYFAVDDPLPFLVHLARTAKHKALRILRPR